MACSNSVDLLYEPDLPDKVCPSLATDLTLSVMCVDSYPAIVFNAALQAPGHLRPRDHSGRQSSTPKVIAELKQVAPGCAQVER